MIVAVAAVAASRSLSLSTIGYGLAVIIPYLDVAFLLFLVEREQERLLLLITGCQ